MQTCGLKNDSGLTLIELVVALAILAVLASAVLPMAEVTVIRTKEIQLKRALRDVRTALDEYKKDHDKAVADKKIFANIDESGYPENLQDLVEGNDWGGLFPYRKKYLRRIPPDPFDSYSEGWGLRSYTDEADSRVWGGEDVYDIYSRSDNVALDGTYYRDW